MTRVKCNCGLCTPQPGRRYHPKWGYDLDKARETRCLYCRQPVGDENYIEETAMARFGQIFLIHQRCAEEGTV